MLCNCFFNISALFCLQRMLNILQTYWKLDIFIKPSDMIKLVKLPRNSKKYVWKTKLAEINAALFLMLYNVFTYQYFNIFPFNSDQSFGLLITDIKSFLKINFLFFYLLIFAIQVEAPSILSFVAWSRTLSHVQEKQ